MSRVKRIWYLSPMRAAKFQTSLNIRTVSPEPPPFAHTSSETRETFRQKTRSLAPLNGWAWAVKICHDGMLEDTNSLEAEQIKNQDTQLSKLHQGTVESINSQQVKYFKDFNPYTGFFLSSPLLPIWFFLVPISFNLDHFTPLFRKSHYSNDESYFLQSLQMRLFYRISEIQSNCQGITQIACLRWGACLIQGPSIPISV